MFLFYTQNYRYDWWVINYKTTLISSSEGILKKIL